MNRLPHLRQLLYAALVSPAFAASASAAGDVGCHAGAYRLDDGAVVAITEVSEPGQLRWRRVDGRTGLLEQRTAGSWTSTLGWTGRADGVEVALGTCDRADIRFDGRTGTRLGFDIRETTFAGDGVTLRGRLLLPPGDAPVPIAVQVHGSEDYSALRFNFMQHLLPALGIGVFVYDRRGTGDSDGRYTQDFHVLAADASAAHAEATRLAGPRAGRVGFHGGSQAGWIAPLAADRSPAAAFVVVGYGLADTPLAEDRDQVMLELRNAGYGDDVLASAREVTDATAMVVASRGARGWERMEAVRAKYAGAPWWGAMRGDFTGLIAHHSREEVTAIAPTVEVGTTWDHDPMPVLRRLQVPQLWVLAGADAEAPPQETQRRLLALATAQRPITVAVFPGTDHGILEFETGVDGQRVPTRIADGYLRMTADWIRNGRLESGAYGSARVLTAPSAHPL